MLQIHSITNSCRFYLSQASKDYKASSNRKVLFITKLVGHWKHIHIFTKSISLYTIIGYSSSSRGLTRRTIRDCFVIVHKILDDLLMQHLAVEIWMSMWFLMCFLPSSKWFLLDTHDTLKIFLAQPLGISIKMSSHFWRWLGKWAWAPAPSLEPGLCCFRRGS